MSRRSVPTVSPALASAMVTRRRFFLKGAAAALLSTLSRPTAAKASADPVQDGSVAIIPTEAAFQFYKVVNVQGERKMFVEPALQGGLVRATAADLMLIDDPHQEPQKPTIEIYPLDPEEPISPDTPVKYMFRDAKGRLDLVLPRGLANSREGVVNFYMNQGLLENYVEDQLGGTLNLSKAFMMRLELDPRSRGWTTSYVRLFSRLAFFDPRGGPNPQLHSKAIGLDFSAINGFHYLWHDSKYNEVCFWDRPEGMSKLPVFDNLIDMESHLIVPLISP